MILFAYGHQSLHGEFVHRTGQDYGDKSMVYPAFPTRLVLRSGLVERDWAIRDVYLQRFAVTALPRQ